MLFAFTIQLPQHPETLRLRRVTKATSSYSLQCNLRGALIYFIGNEKFPIKQIKTANLKQISSFCFRMCHVTILLQCIHVSTTFFNHFSESGNTYKKDNTAVQTVSHKIKSYLPFFIPFPYALTICAKYIRNAFSEL